MVGRGRSAKFKLRVVSYFRKVDCFFGKPNHDAIFFEDNPVDRSANRSCLGRDSRFPALAAVVALRSSPAGVGARRTRLPYKLSFDAKTTRVERLALLDGAIDGELQGCGRWHFYRHDDVTAIRYDWAVNVHQPWLRCLVLLSRRAMKWNHHALMLAGGQRSARHVGARFLGLKEDA